MKPGSRFSLAVSAVAVLLTLIGFFGLPSASAQTTYDVVFANPSNNQTVTFAANVCWAY